MSIIPASRPRLSRCEAEQIIEDHKVESELAIVAVRGYYGKMFAPDGNNRGVYDDALFVVSPDAFVAFNANCDPSVKKAGIATLKCGKYDCVKWRHRGRYHALQIIRDVVTRDGKTGEDVGRHGINIHYGSERATWSEGCQTLPKSQYDAFVKLVYAEMERRSLKTVPYILIDQK